NLLTLRLEFDHNESLHLPKYGLECLKLVTPFYKALYHVCADTWFSYLKNFLKVSYGNRSWIRFCIHCFSTFKQFINNPKLNRLANIFDVTGTVSFCQLSKFFRFQ